MNGSISMKATLGAPLLEVSWVLLIGFSRAPMKSVSRRNCRQARGNCRTVSTDDRKRRAPAMRNLSSMRSRRTAWSIRLFWSWIQTPHGLANGFDVSGNMRVWKPYVFHIPIAKAPSEMAPLTFGISHLMSPAEISAFPLNHPTARNDMPLGLLSARAGTASPRTISVATAVLPAGLHLVILMTLLPPLQPRRLHASELISHLLGRKLHQPRPPDRLEAHEADAPRGRLLVGVHGERQRRRRAVVRYRGRHPCSPDEPVEPLDGRRVAQAERPGHACRGHHADRDRLPVQQPAVLGEHLEGVAHGVPEVEHRPLATLLPLVRGDHPSLVPAAGGDHGDQDRLLEPEQRIEPRLQRREQLGAAEPARSPTPPPPSAISGERRSIPASSRRS